MSKVFLLIYSIKIVFILGFSNENKILFLQFTTSGYMVLGDIYTRDPNYQPAAPKVAISPPSVNFTQVNLFPMFNKGSTGFLSNPDRVIFAPFWGKLKVNSADV